MKEHPLSCGSQSEGEWVSSPPSPCSCWMELLHRAFLCRAKPSARPQGYKWTWPLPRPPSTTRCCRKSEQGQASSELGKQTFLPLPHGRTSVSFGFGGSYLCPQEGSAAELEVCTMRAGGPRPACHAGADLEVLSPLATPRTAPQMSV